MDNANQRIFKPQREEETIKLLRLFFKLHCANKGIDAVIISNMLNHKNVQSCIPPYFQLRYTSCISYN